MKLKINAFNKQGKYISPSKVWLKMKQTPATSKSCIFFAEHATAIDMLLVLYVPGCMNYYCHLTFYIPSSIAYSNTYRQLWQTIADLWQCLLLIKHCSLFACSVMQRHPNSLRQKTHKLLRLGFLVLSRDPRHETQITDTSSPIGRQTELSHKLQVLQRKAHCMVILKRKAGC